MISLIVFTDNYLRTPHDFYITWNSLHFHYTINIYLKMSQFRFSNIQSCKNIPFKHKIKNWQVNKKKQKSLSVQKLRVPATCIFTQNTSQFQSRFAQKWEDLSS